MLTSIYLLDMPEPIGRAETMDGVRQIVAGAMDCAPWDVETTDGLDPTGEYVEWVLAEGEIVGSLDRPASLEEPTRAPGHTDLMISPEAIDEVVADMIPIETTKTWADRRRRVQANIECDAIERAARHLAPALPYIDIGDEREVLEVLDALFPEDVGAADEISPEVLSCIIDRAREIVHTRQEVGVWA